MKILKQNKGFTLIELLVVVAIIGILASVILVSLTSARSKARDARRVSDIQQLRNALELYFSTYNRYPTYAEFYPTGGTCATGANCIAPQFMPTMPKDPLTGVAYLYSAITTPPDATQCLSYHIGTTLEQAGPNVPVLQTKAGKYFSAPASTSVPGLCTGGSAGGSDFDGTNAGTGANVYDLVP